MSLHLLRRTFRAMGAEQELTLWATEPAQAQRAAAAAIADVARIEAKYSRYRDDSLTSRINRAAGGAPVAIDDETVALLRYGQQCHQLSGGLFDLTSGVLRQVWDFGRPVPALPDPAVLSAATALVDWAAVAWDAHTIRLPRAGMEIDFGGIGKEYAADRVATICMEHGVRHGLVNLGGDLRAIGPQGDDAPWRVGIRHPRRAGSAVASVDLAAGALATSGDYERFVDIAGRRYSHILNPRTGMPVAHWQSVTVIAPLCVVAGSCATIAMLLEDRAAAFLEAQDVTWLAVAADGTLHSNARDPGNAGRVDRRN